MPWRSLLAQDFIPIRDIFLECLRHMPRSSKTVGLLMSRDWIGGSSQEILDAMDFRHIPNDMASTLKGKEGK